MTLAFETIPTANQYVVVCSGPGSAGPGDLHYTFTQLTAAATWTVAHNLGKYPSVSIVDTGNTQLMADVHYVDANNLTISFGAATSGSAYIN